MSEGAGRKGMSDIVERLRSADVLIVKSATDLRSVVAEEAADEIEKLRAWVNKILQENRAMEKKIEKAAAIIINARAALGEKE
jgi:hypothetical protein